MAVTKSRVGSSDVTVGSPANGLSITNDVLTLGAADGSTAGALTATTQTIAGVKTFSSAVTSSVATGNNGVNLSNNGARVQLGAGANTYIYGDGFGIQTPGYLLSGNAVYSPTFQGASGVSAEVVGRAADGGTAVGVKLATDATYANAAAKLVSVRNLAAEKAFFNKDGELELTTVDKGIILKSADGTRWRLTITDLGVALVAAA